MKKRTRCMYTKEKAIKIWQLCNFDKMTQAQASKNVGCNKGAANRWFNLVKDTPALLGRGRVVKSRMKLLSRRSMSWILCVMKTSFCSGGTRVSVKAGWICY